MLCWYAGVLQQLLCCCDIDTAGRLPDHGVSIPQGMLACAYISTGWRFESSLRQANLLVCARCIASWAARLQLWSVCALYSLKEPRHSCSSQRGLARAATARSAAELCGIATLQGMGGACFWHERGVRAAGGRRRRGSAGAGPRGAPQQGLQLQEERLPEEVLRVLPGLHLLLRQLQVHRLQEF